MSKEKSEFNKFLHIFVRWLKNMGIYHQYVRNVKAQIRSNGTQTDVIHFIYKRIENVFERDTINYFKACNVIDNTLYWDSTFEGFHFWNTMNSLFHNFYLSLRQ